MQPALERLFERLVFGPEVDAGDPAQVQALLGASGLSVSDREALFEDFERLAVYRKLVRSTLREALELAMPRSVARLGRLFDASFDRFLDERGPRTHVLREVTQEFLEFVEPLWRGDARFPAWTLDLARHEAIRIEIGARRATPQREEPEPLALERGVRFIEAVALMRYGFAVQRLSADEADRSEPAREPVRLLVYRSPEHEVRYLELSPLADAILSRLLASQTLEDALRGAAEELGVALDAGVLEGSARLLADLAERGALVGAARAEAPKDVADARNPPNPGTRA